MQRINTFAWSTVPIGGLVRSDGGYWVHRSRSGFDVVRGKGSSDFLPARKSGDALYKLDWLQDDGGGDMVAVLSPDQWSAADFHAAERVAQERSS